MSDLRIRLGHTLGPPLVLGRFLVLSIMPMPEAGRQTIYGLVIILMLLAFGRRGRVSS